LIIDIPISVGELVDKVSILIIKSEKISDKKKLVLIHNELSLLQKILKKITNKKSEIKDEISIHLEQLIQVNNQLWTIEDDIRSCERKKIFDKHFIDLARSVYINNDKRSEIKKEINSKFGSKIIEIKSYEKY